MIRVLLVEDHASFRQALAFMLEQEPDLKVVAEVGSLAEGRRALGEGNGIDVAVVDLNLPDGDGVELVRDLRRVNARGAILVLSGIAERRHWGLAVEAGAAGVLHKSAPLAEIVRAVRRLHAGELLLPVEELLDLLRLAGEQHARARRGEHALARLTPREREVLQGLADGLTDKEIARRLRISPETARTHVANILGKLGVESRLQALAHAARHDAVTFG